MKFLMFIKIPKCQEIKTIVGGTEQADQNQLTTHPKTINLPNYKNYGKKSSVMVSES